MLEESHSSSGRCLRNPTTDDPETRVFGIVGADYHLVTPDDFVSIWDERVGRPIETIGALGFGETFFISTTLPKMDVRGDEVEFYLLRQTDPDGSGSERDHDHGRQGGVPEHTERCRGVYDEPPQGCP